MSVPKQGSKSCWISVENRSENPILIKKFKKIDFLSTKRVFHPEETGIITEGDEWDTPFLVKIFSLSPKMKTTLLLKLEVNKIYKVIVRPDRCSCKTVKPENVDLQLCAYKRMEEIWERSDYYETLRISQNATSKEIRIAYLKLAREYHPDHNSNPYARLMFERVVEAYNTLIDDEIRRQYDIHLRTDAGAFSKSYWRQAFCFWNKNKAFQVGISTMLTITGSAIMFTSLLAVPTGVGIPLAMATGAAGGGMFASGVGSLSVALSRQSALEDNKLYSRWSKYGFWYGVAGAATGAFSAGIGTILGPAVGGGVGGFMATATVNGAASGVAFNSANGLASDKWVALLTRLRVDAIALDLAVASVTGAATGLVFQSMLMSMKTASAVASQAKFSAKSFASLGGTEAQNTLQKNQKLIRSNSDPLLLAEIAANATMNFDENQNNDNNPKKETAELEKEIEQQLEESTIDNINEAIELYEEVVHKPTPHVFIFHNSSKFTRVRMRVEFTIFKEEENDIQLVKECPSSDKIFKIPSQAKFIQVYFEYSPFGQQWKSIDTYNTTKTFCYEKPVTRRFFIGNHKEIGVAVTQIRNEYEQIAKHE